jgi:hypothetical protein
VGGQRIHEVEFKSKVVSYDEISDKLSAYKVVDTLHATKQNGFDRFYIVQSGYFKDFLLFCRLVQTLHFLTGRGASVHAAPRRGDVCYHHRELALKLSRLSAVTTSN